MKETSPSAPVVVGVDGSDAALNAVKWAIDEAIARDVPLRIVHVTNIERHPGSPADDAFRLDVQYAEASLRAATAAVNATGKPVKTETEILWGPVDTVLVNESGSAAMICVGSVGIGPIARKLLGSTASALAEKAQCPVAIIRAPHIKPAEGADWIVVVVDDDPDNGAVIESAMKEARLRQAPILALGVWQEDLGETPYDTLDRRVEVWKQRYPDVRIYPVATGGGVARFLAENRDESAQLAVVGSADAYRARQIIGPHRHARRRRGECSVLVVR